MRWTVRAWLWQPVGKRARQLTATITCASVFVRFGCVSRSSRFLFWPSKALFSPPVRMMPCGHPVNVQRPIKCSQLLSIQRQRLWARASLVRPTWRFLQAVYSVTLGGGNGPLKLYEHAPMNTRDFPFLIKKRIIELVLVTRI